MNRRRSYTGAADWKRWLTTRLLCAALLAATCLLALGHSAAAAPHHTQTPCGSFTTYVHTATAANSYADWTDLDNPVTNNCPGERVVVTATYTPGGVYDTHPLGVFYHGLAYKWALFHEDQTLVPIGATYFVIAVGDDEITIHTATAANSFGDWTATGLASPDYRMIVTPNYTVGNVYDPHVLGVWYASGQWYIFHEDGTPIPVGASYNISWPLGGHLVQTATTTNSIYDYTIINDAELNNYPSAHVFVIADYTSTLVYDPHVLGVWYTGGGNWTIFHEDRTAIPVGATYMVVFSH